MTLSDLAKYTMTRSTRGLCVTAELLVVFSCSCYRAESDSGVVRDWKFVWSLNFGKSLLLILWQYGNIWCLTAVFQDGLMIVSATYRYRKKYVTTLLYKPCWLSLVLRWLFRLVMLYTFCSTIGSFACFYIYLDVFC